MPSCSQIFIDSSSTDKAWWRLGKRENLSPDWLYYGVVCDCTITKYMLIG